MSGTQKALVSVIMSVYNTEKFLPVSIQSVLDQTYENLEFIIVNNGSDDHSSEQIKAFMEKDPRIVLIDNKENRFLAEARNQALDICKGKYVYIVDSDDSVEPDAVRFSVEIAEKNDLDLVVFGWSMEYVLENQHLSLPVCPEERVFLNKEDFRHNAARYLNQSILTVPWNKLYKREIIENNHIRYRVTKLEDHHFNMDYIKDIEKVAFVPNPLYHYFRSRSSSELNSVYHFHLFQKKKEHYLHTKEIFTYWQLKDDASWVTLYTFFAERIVQCVQEIVANESYSKKGKKKLIAEILEDTDAREAIKKARPDGLMKIMVLPLKWNWKFLCIAEAKFINRYRERNRAKYVRIQAKQVNKAKEKTL